MAMLTIDLDTPRRRAAAENPAVSATATKTPRSSRVGLRGLVASMNSEFSDGPIICQPRTP